jgi:signal transduction histidine kinase
MTFVGLFGGADDVPGLEPDLRWAWLTIVLSGLLATGYVVIACKWYFQSKLHRRRECRAALARLGAIVLCCGAFGTWFLASDMPWPAWRVYDGVLLALVVYTWWFAARMRGLSLIDERLAHTDELERSSNRYREIAELLPHVVWTAGVDGTVDFANRRWAEYAGEGRTWLDAVHPDEWANVVQWWNGVVRAGAPASREVLLGGPAGYRTFVVSAAPIAHGKAVKWLGACADVEDQKRLAAEKEVQARQKTFFLNSLSHDLRAPLNNVVLNAHLLKMTVREESQLETANVIVENAVAAGELVTKLLDVARAGGDRNAADVVPLGPMLRQIARRFQPVAEQKGLWLRVANGDAELLTDRQKLERVVANLVDNAIKFTDRGGVLLELVRRVDATRIRVCDTGIGVPDGQAPYLFDEFYQVDNHERDRRKGFGMGLSICRSLARQLGGDVRLASTGPGGSCFEVVVDGLAGGVAGGGPGGGGRQGGEAGDLAHPEREGVCRV